MRLLRSQGEHGRAEQDSDRETGVHDDNLQWVLLVEDFEHVVGGFLALHQAELLHDGRLERGVLLGASQGDKIVGVAGVAGNGQSELMRALAGLQQSKGAIQLNGRALDHGVGAVQNERGRVADDRGARAHVQG